MVTLHSHDPLAVAVTEAIHTGDLPALEQLLADHPGLATTRISEAAGEGCAGRASRSLLHIAADWPGHFPNGPAVVAALAAAGADPNARFDGSHTETPLHWAASSNDVAVLDALIEAGADLEAPGAVIGGGTPLADARAFGQWQAAYRLIEHGAHITLHDAATLGLLDHVEAFVDAREAPAPDEVTRAFWGACQGGHLQTAQYLLRRGADINWIGYDDKTPLDTALASEADEVSDWLRSQGAKSRSELPRRP
ncbi:ankyrin repeat domain-containing protein [Streptomyces sp. NPDC029004]|uniref:ankyrin repeat domain-containing protein n=1 Tax=Streptomyces sp. NPDC029004 TaxID=3154490 RepID=UPI00340BE4A3